jgi:hypothetical protein
VNKCVINLATNIDWYPAGQARMVRTVREHGFDGEIYCWGDEADIGAEPHAKVPYGFKTAAFNVVQKAGFDLVLWLDASMWATGSVQPIFDHIERHGHLMELAGWSAGQWCTDAALGTLGVTRDEAMNMPLFSAGFLGLNLRNDKSAEFLRRWSDLSKDGVSFIGPWDNRDGSCSADSRVLGHRHDMTAASVLAHKLEMKLIPPTFMAYDGPGPHAATTCVKCRGGVL